MKRERFTLYIDLAFCGVLLPMLIMMLPLDKWMEHHSLFVKLLIAWLYVLYGLLRLIIVPQLFARRYFLSIGLFLGTILFTHELTLFDSDFNTYLAKNPPTVAATVATADTTSTQAQTPTPNNNRTRPQERNDGGGNNSGGGNSGGGNVNNNNNNSRPRPTAPDMMRMQMRRNFTSQQQQSGWFLYVLVVSFGYAVALLSQLNKQISLNKDIELEKRRAELALYKAQINPHFLFNTLNTIYGLIITKSDKAEEAFMLFTNLMKYIYTNGTADIIPVDDEVDYIEQYIELQRLRINPSTQINFDYKNNATGGVGLRIAPMLLITFVENAIKYGVSSHTPSKINIEIEIEGQQLRLMTHNPILNDNNNSDSTEKHDGIGIKNCRQRLLLLYPKCHSLEIRDNGEEFHVELSIQLANHKSATLS
ncbi:MAG: histidine kinase [Rikenellaceae bacterium]